MLIYKVYSMFLFFFSQDNQEPNGVVYQVRGSDQVLFHFAALLLAFTFLMSFFLSRSSGDQLTQILTRCLSLLREK